MNPTDPASGFPSPAEFPTGSLESRAAARLLAEKTKRPLVEVVSRWDFPDQLALEAYVDSRRRLGIQIRVDWKLDNEELVKLMEPLRQKLMGKRQALPSTTVREGDSE